MHFQSFYVAVLPFQNIRPIPLYKFPHLALAHFHHKFNWTTSQVTETWRENIYSDGQQIMRETFCIFANAQYGRNSILSEPSPYIHTLQPNINIKVVHK